jgi:PAS domain S-box-containing protein
MVMLFVAGFQLIQMNSIMQDSRLLYEHPYKVSNATEKIKLEMFKTVNLSRYITLTNNGRELDSIKMEIAREDEIITNSYKSISANYLGNKSDVDSFYNAFLAWKSIRNGFYRLKIENKTDSIRYLIKFNARFKFDKSIHYLEVISAFADRKAEETVNKISVNEKGGFNFTTGLLIISGLLVIFFIVYLSRSIIRPIKKFVAEANTIMNPLIPSPKAYQDEELLMLTLDELKKAYKSIEQQAADIDAYNKKLADQNISLEYNVKQRTAELQQEVEVRKQAEEKINSIAERYNLMLDQQPYGILVVSADGKGEFVNQIFCDFLYLKEKPEDLRGLSSEEIIGKVLPAYAEPETVLSMIKEVVARCEPFHNYEINMLDGRVLLMDFEPLTIDGKNTGRMWIHRDITERKHSEDTLVLEKNKLQATLENTHIGFVLCDKEGENISMNKAALRFHGFPSSNEMHSRLGEYVGEWELRYPDGRLMPIEEWPMGRAIQGDYVNNFEAYLHNVKSDYRWVGSYTALPVLNIKGEVTLIVMTILDITEQKKSEVLIKNTLSKLEHSNKELEQFAYVASHDLQEPLRMVSSYTQLLAKRYEDKLDSDAREFIEYAVSGAMRMQGLINDLLDYSRLNTRKKPYVLANCNSLLGKVRINLSVLINEENAVLTNDELPTVMADETQLMQLFQNLIINGIKYHNHEAPHVHISSKEESNELIFSVKDNGIGIDKEFHERIFGIFQRLHSRDEYSGTGIGLAICRRIVERHGGRIWLESEKDKGTTFYFTIPK